MRITLIKGIIAQNAVPNTNTAATVVILPSAGGTTNPAPGTYLLADASHYNIQAVPNSGWQFSHWTICGTNAIHGSSPVNWNPTDNPYNVNHGYGDVYRYQAVFVPIGSSTEPTPTPTSTTAGTVGGMSNEMLIIIGLAVVIVFLLIALAVVYAGRRHK